MLRFLRTKVIEWSKGTTKRQLISENLFYFLHCCHWIKLWWNLKRLSFSFKSLVRLIFLQVFFEPFCLPRITDRLTESSLCFSTFTILDIYLPFFSFNTSLVIWHAFINCIWSTLKPEVPSAVTLTCRSKFEFQPSLFAFTAH